MAQSKDLILSESTSDSTSISYSNFNWSDEQNVTDTIKVIMLVSDNFNHVKVMNGFQVRKQDGFYNGNTSRNSVYIAVKNMVPVMYLDENKINLSPNISVWMSKEFKK
jgi:hypothetical protein